MIHISAEKTPKGTGLKSRHSVKFAFQMNKEYFCVCVCVCAPDTAWDILELKINLSFILNPNSNGHPVSCFAKYGYPKISPEWAH